MPRQMPTSKHLDSRELFWLLGSLSNLYRIPFDPALLAQEFPPPYAIANLHEAARAIGIRTEEKQQPDAISCAGIANSWASISLPAVAFYEAPSNCSSLGHVTSAAHVLHVVGPNEPGDAGESEGSAPGVDREIRLHAALILKADKDSLLYFTAGADAPKSISIDDARQLFSPQLIVVSKDSAASTSSVGEDEQFPGCVTEKKEFGFRWFLPELLKHKKIWRDILLASLAVQLVGLATPLFTQAIIDKVVVHQTESTLIVLGVALVMFMLFTSAMTWLRQYLVLHTGNRIDAVLGSQVFRHLLRLPLPYFEQRPTGTLVARLHGIETIREFISGAAVTLILDLPFLVIFLAVMFLYSWQLSLIAMGLLALVGLVSFLVTPLFRERLNKQFLLGARNQAFLTEYLSGMSTVKSLQMEPDIERKYCDLFAQYLAAGFSTKQVGNSYNVVANGLEQVMTLSILIVGALLVMDNDGFTIGMLVAFQMFASRMSQPMLRLVSLWQEFQQANIAVKRLGDILDIPQEPHTLKPSRERASEGRLDLVSLGFRYSDKHPWLYRNLSIRFKPGHLTVLMGPSGCGKSTLAKLLLGFYQPEEGHIALDGRDIRYLAANELRQTFGVVPQETVLFSGTVYDNLVMAHPHANFQDVIAACKAAEIHEVIEKLQNGYQTEIGERGTGLSGGQKQRMAIARALLKKPKILVFDEAASNLDQSAAEHFARTISRLKSNVTILFITHHVPRGLLVDEVIELSNYLNIKVDAIERA